MGQTLSSCAAQAVADPMGPPVSSWTKTRKKKGSAVMLEAMATHRAGAGMQSGLPMLLHNPAAGTVHSTRAAVGGAAAMQATVTPAILVSSFVTALWQLVHVDQTGIHMHFGFS